jgi:hypothetical protein
VRKLRGEIAIKVDKIEVRRQDECEEMEDDGNPARE